MFSDQLSGARISATAMTRHSDGQRSRSPIAPGSTITRLLLGARAKPNCARQRQDIGGTQLLQAAPGGAFAFGQQRHVIGLAATPGFWPIGLSADYGSMRDQSTPGPSAPAVEEHDRQCDQATGSSSWADDELRILRRLLELANKPNADLRAELMKLRTAVLTSGPGHPSSQVPVDNVVGYP